MDLSATDVENREFSEGRKGYVREEVDRFLDEVAAQFRRYEERLQAMSQRASAVEGELSKSRETEEMTRRMLLVAQRAADEAVAEAEEKARQLVEDAEGRATALDEDTKSRRTALEADVEGLRRFEADFRAQLRQILDGHLALLQRTGRSSAEMGPSPTAALHAQPSPSATSRPTGPTGAPLTPRPAVAQPAAGSPSPASPPDAGTRQGPPVRVADNEVLRRLAEGRPEPGTGS